MGGIDGENCYGAAKVRAVSEALPERKNCTITTYTDHHSDWDLLLESDIPVAVNPTRKLRRLAHARGIEITRILNL